MSVRVEVAAAAAALSLLAFAGAARAQTADDLFDDAVLHRVDLYVNTRDWQQLQRTFQLNDFYPANLKWRGLTARNVGIRSRGFGTRSPSKPGLLVDFDHFTSGQRFVGLKALVLDNLGQDPSGVRESVAMKFTRRMGLPAPREAHAALYVNNLYWGLYAVVEEIDEVAVGRLFGESGGHLFEYHWKFDYHLEYLGSDLVRYAELLEPRTREHESDLALYGPIERMIRTVNEAFDDAFESAVSEYIDLTQVMRYAAVQNYLAELDGLLGYAGINNFYLYRLQDTMLSRLIPWDQDNSFFALDYPILQGHAENILTRRAMQVPALRQVYFETLLACAASADEREDPGTPGGDGTQPQGWLEREVARQQALVRDAALADTRKNFSRQEYDDASAAVLRFAQARGAFVRCEVGRQTDPVRAGDVCAPGGGLAGDRPGVGAQHAVPLPSAGPTGAGQASYKGGGRRDTFRRVKSRADHVSSMAQTL